MLPLYSGESLKFSFAKSIKHFLLVAVTLLTLTSVSAVEPVAVHPGDFLPYRGYGELVITQEEIPTLHRNVCERILQAEILWSIFAPKEFPLEKFEIAWKTATMNDDLLGVFGQGGMPVEKIVVVNTLPRVREGICLLGVTEKKPEFTGDLAIYRNNHGTEIPVQFVPHGTDPPAWSVYADFLYNDPTYTVPAMGAVILEFDAQATAKQTKRKTTLSVNLETGEMGNDDTKLVIDREKGTITSLKMLGVEHDLVDVAGNSIQSLNYFQMLSFKSGYSDDDPKKAELKLLAAGPLVASVSVCQTPDRPIGGLSRLERTITIFSDTERIRIENALYFDENNDSGLCLFSFPFDIPNGKIRLDQPNSFGLVDQDDGFYRLQRYAVLAGEDSGVNWVTVDAGLILNTELDTPNEKKILAGGIIDSRDAAKSKILRSEYWIWPYTASFNNGIAQRFARFVHQPLVCFPASEKFGPKSGLFTLNNDRVLAVSSIRPVRDGDALEIRVFNPTADKQSVTLKPLAPYKTVLPAPKFDLAPGEAATLHME